MSMSRDKKITLGILLALFFVQGIIDYILGNGEVLAQLDAYQMYSLIRIVVNTVFFVRWFWLDAQERNFTFSKVFLMMLVAFGPITAVYYLFKTRGRQAWRPLLKMLLFFLVACVVFSLGQGIGYVVSLQH